MLCRATSAALNLASASLGSPFKFNAEAYFSKELPIHAEWFSGTLYLGLGKLIRIEGSFNPIYEIREEISLDNGSVVKRVKKQYDTKQGKYTEI